MDSPKPGGLGPTSRVCHSLIVPRPTLFLVVSALLNLKGVGRGTISVSEGHTEKCE